MLFLKILRTHPNNNSTRALIEAYEAIFEHNYRIATSNGTAVVSEDDVSAFVKHRSVTADDEYTLSMCTLGLRDVVSNIQDVIDRATFKGIATARMGASVPIPTEIRNILNAYDYLKNFANYIIPAANRAERAMIDAGIRQCTAIVSLFLKAKARSIDFISPEHFRGMLDGSTQQAGVSDEIMQKLIFALS